MNTSLRRALAAAALITGVAGLSTQARACGQEAYIGEICNFASNYCPVNFAEANGALLSVSANQPLFALIGTSFGGDGVNTFGLPDLRGRFTVDQNPTGQTGGVQLPFAAKTGAPTATVGVANLPSGNATGTAGALNFTAVTTVKVSADPTTGGGNILTQNGRGRGYNAAGTATSGSLGAVQTTVTGSGSGSLALSGGNQAFATQSPTLAVTVCIATIGLYPDKP